MANSDLKRSLWRIAKGGSCELKCKHGVNVQVVSIEEKRDEKDDTFTEKTNLYAELFKSAHTDSQKRAIFAGSVNYFYKERFFSKDGKRYQVVLLEEITAEIVEDVISGKFRGSPIESIVMVALNNKQHDIGSQNYFLKIMVDMTSKYLKGEILDFNNLRRHSEFLYNRYQIPEKEKIDYFSSFYEGVLEVKEVKR